MYRWLEGANSAKDLVFYRLYYIRYFASVRPLPNSDWLSHAKTMTPLAITHDWATTLKGRREKGFLIDGPSLLFRSRLLCVCVVYRIGYISSLRFLSDTQRGGLKKIFFFLNKRKVFFDSFSHGVSERKKILRCPAGENGGRDLFVVATRRPLSSRTNQKDTYTIG